ncbi:ribosome assembly factor SBDS [archaeon]|jgi:ribosome maturation protein SDO1|nr:ribosome assembly factor SBDS [archaeon]MBT4373604.1 ribosome assembly factor SBDS [archaeon]MBT4532052.1 ribosome assembly factor SBDS [archaeon]MBT7001719.1 ribosome assembly factor SBDS [archaeon]MBT7282389.1 ribosome assembly factor SBDS [archaeon]
MTSTTARITREGKQFEVLVDMEEALKFRKSGGSEGTIMLETDVIFLNVKQGEKASQDDLQKVFGTTDVQKIAEDIVKRGEIEESQEHRNAEQEAKFKQVVDFLTTNAIDPQSGNPITTERIKNALEQAHVQIKNKPIEDQIKDILPELTKIIPIKIETKKVKITIPAQYTGQAYGVIAKYKESENWKDNGSLEVLVNVPAGLIMDFYDKLNSITHGSALTEDIKE